MIAALWEVLAGFSTLVLLGVLVWHIANAIEAWRYLRRRRGPFLLRIRFVRPRISRSNVVRFPERNRAS
jgi:hypothetical protein